MRERKLRSSKMTFRKKVHNRARYIRGVVLHNVNYKRYNSMMTIITEGNVVDSDFAQSSFCQRIYDAQRIFKILLIKGGARNYANLKRNSLLEQIITEKEKSKTRETRVQEIEIYEAKETNICVIGSEILNYPMNYL
ncbi:PREDICTED: uncharacterized protein LOC106740813 [Dinoponera quadriceps]|uniref:Uncharacterized protein LOC106740813 n=1 Tax=Dinoponera quadriceps TaxID=609295 RepID=A0A6P3WNU2_DINQU|nr:PREDICTED: uncharacterized protein LOC106740813 [Dinoponera quadriceps]